MHNCLHDRYVFYNGTSGHMLGSLIVGSQGTSVGGRMVLFL